jgi:hypothetical protein
VREPPSLARALQLADQEHRRGDQEHRRDDQAPQRGAREPLKDSEAQRRSRRYFHFSNSSEATTNMSAGRHVRPQDVGPDT